MKVKYSIAEVKRMFEAFTKMGYQPELTLKFVNKKPEYMIISYREKVSFQRCGNEKTASGEIYYKNLDELFQMKQLIDGVCLYRDWKKLEYLYCAPDFNDFEYIVGEYKKRTEK
jgi:poly-D-alanine transfer protein DltD